MGKAEATRKAILQKAFDMMYMNGYKTTSIDTIIANTEVTKGAFFYHFKNKDEMGIAIVNEILKPALTGNLTKALEAVPNPLVAIYNLIHTLLLETSFLKIEYGCPASNFVHEMTPWNAAFTRALDKLTGEWVDKMTNIISNGKANGFVGKDVNARQATLFILSGYWGIRNFGKLQNARNVYVPYLKELKNYLNSLK